MPHPSQRSSTFLAAHGPEGKVVSSPSGPLPETSSGNPLRGLFDFLRSHPVLCLLLLTPGIPEYLSGSSPLGNILLNPSSFFFGLFANLGLYGSGALLIREAMVRWNKGWPSALLMGGAYGILEEGIGLSTLFNSKAGPVGKLGYYGHWLGVNWVWAAAIVPFHAVFSISMPILLLGLALPRTRGKSLLSNRGIRTVFIILSIDVAVLFLFVFYGEHFWMGFPVFFGAFVVMGVLVYLARRASGRPIAHGPSPTKGPRTMLLLGIIYYPCVLITEGLGTGLGVHLEAFPDFVLAALVEGAFLIYLTRVIGSSHNEPQLIAFTFGLIVPIAAIGLIATIRFPAELLGDLAYILFFVMLWRKYPAVHPSIDAGASAEDAKGLSEI